MVAPMSKHIPPSDEPSAPTPNRGRAVRRWSSVAALSAGALILSGCGGTTPSPTGTTKTGSAAHPSVKTIVTIAIPTPPTGTATTGKKKTKHLKDPTLRKPVILGKKSRFVRLLWLGPKCVGHLGDKPSDVKVQYTDKLVKLSLTEPKCGVPGGATVKHGLKVKLSKGVGKRKVQVSMKPAAGPKTTKSPSSSSGPTTGTTTSTP